MPLEDLEGPDKFLDALNRLWPLGTDEKQEGDDHIRGHKNVVLNSFPTVAEARYPASFILPPAGESEEKAGALEVAVGSDAQRPASVSSGALRWNNEQNVLEQYKAGTWSPLDPTKAAGDMLAAGATGAALEKVTPSAAMQVPMWNGTKVNYEFPVIQGDINGFQVQWLSANTYTVGAGVLMSEDNSISVEMSAVTKDLALAWAEGNNNGGAFTPLTADSSFHFIVIRKDDDGTVEWGMDDNVDGTNAPAGWSVMRRVASFTTDSGANLVVVRQVQDRFLIQDHVSQAISGVGQGSSVTNHRINRIPLGVEVGVFGSILADRNSSSCGAGIYSANVLTAAGNPGRQAWFSGPGSPVETVSGFAECWSDKSGTLAMNRQTGTNNPDVVVMGWLDPRGKF